ncbi:putative AAA+ superfamily ATPase [Ereboglobus sp. PH5-5]|uniref:ATP-binding protein n=1 Tax=Ereboglobus sp. PH5-5 TaxID=2940529 RepID=UPI0024061548|nr:AAA family ATPase [Ereboglobus sp. PH5-5]MDF9833949.1 putative AAA+ superfamily ATPase [Ereboglobus sp. PH5-5]
MSQRLRFYDSLLAWHLKEYRQMAFVSGPRQVGKTTVCEGTADVCWNWDNTDDRRLMLSGPSVMADKIGIDQLREKPPVVAFDELHKYSKWKTLLKGFFDTYGKKIKVVVTGSSRLDVFRRGGDSLMGRYLLYRMHPWSVAECLHTDMPANPVRLPKNVTDADWDALWAHGGFPEPFLKRDARFTRRWNTLRQEQLSREDLREVSQLQDLGTVEVLVQLLAERSSQQLVYANLASEIGVSVNTIKRWVDLLGRLHYGFLVRPWFKNINKALRKEPKWFLRDWSGIEDVGARAETFAACHLLKAVEGWTDMGLGRFELYYLRDKMKREVDFLVTRDRKPWFLAEVKHSETTISPALGYFQRETKAAHAFQVVLDMPYVNADCFKESAPVVVPARTLFSQLL